VNGTADALRRFRPDPFMVGLLVALTAGLLAPAHGDAAQAVALAAKLGIGLLFFLHGAKLSRGAILAGAAHWRLHLLVLGATFGLFPVLGLGIERVAGAFLPPNLAVGFLFLCLLPSTVQSSIAFTAIGRGNVPAAVCSASISNLLGIFLTPALVGLLITAHGGGLSWDSVRVILVELLAPFVAGHVLQPWIGGWVARRRRLVAWVDRGSILLVVYSAFGAAAVEGLWRRVSAADLAIVAAISVVLLAVMLAATVFGARRLGFSTDDEVTITFCGSKKSLASGVPIAGALFAPAAVGAVILPLMVFHQIQLMACAVLARRYAARPDAPAAA
jgi:sodium/bile acid cotransporter 7